jgi:hypothetical protein
VPASLGAIGSAAAAIVMDFGPSEARAGGYERVYHAPSLGLALSKSKSIFGHPLGVMIVSRVIHLIHGHWYLIKYLTDLRRAQIRHPFFVHHDISFSKLRACSFLSLCSHKSGASATRCASVLTPKDTSTCPSTLVQCCTSQPDAGSGQSSQDSHANLTDY